ncbi:hypothetical protein TNCV_1953621 [Trichonephila clavipes]|nr:hypothetical protein TNCV_1953621 [Trichonephila clavipes]
MRSRVKRTSCLRTGSVPNEKWKDEYYAVCRRSVNPKSLAIHDGYSSVCKFLNPGNRQVAACDQTWIVQRYQPFHYQVYPRVQVPRKKIISKPFLSNFRRRISISITVGGLRSVKKCQCTHKNDGD